MLLLIALVRLPFWPGARALRDGIAYSIGALVTHVAHPPGSVGYCLLGGWLNHFVGHVEATFIYINLVAGLIGTYLCYRLALTARLSATTALLAAATYGLSINTLTAALTIAPHLIEGVGAILAAWLGLLGIRYRSVRYALACTLTVALIGSFRPTASAFLIPLWLYSIYKSEALPIHQRLPVLGMHFLIFVAIAGAWSYANNYYMTRAGYGGTTYEKQVLTPAPYDYVTMSTDVRATASRHTFHLPAAEMIAWLEPRLHVRMLPHIPDWPTPSLGRAVKLSVQQAVKQITFLLVSVPAVGIVALIWIIERNTRRRWLNWDALDRSTWVLLICWITPAALFFILGHLGTLTYLQNYLGGMSLLCAALLGPRSAESKIEETEPSSINKIGGTNPPDSARKKRQTKPRPWLTFGPAILCAAAGAMIFTFAKPLAMPGRAANLINVSLLQYTGHAKAAGYGASRITSVLATTAPADDPYLNANTDAALIDAAMKNHFEYLNPDQSNPQP